MSATHDSIRLLIVEDHAALAENLSEFFNDGRYILDFASNGMTALHLIASNDYDVIILDVMLPGVSGFDICRRIRNDMHCTTPVIMVTAKDQLQDKETGFTLGADDYLVKPFDLRELQLRVNALHRRRLGASTVVLHAAGMSFNPGTLEVQAVDGRSLELSGTAARIFETLIRAYPGLVSYDQLRDQVWGEREADIHTLRTHVYGLRKQIQDALGMTVIKTLHGRGYRLVSPQADT